ncbi:5'-nucleotidase C-terminal domain-containing protein [Cellulomonas marina]|uniref:2',3'-cyclic-nucleotide 2'-phosphodiesterase / 3'-nucleotidase n=1 Tax=Cellulomonas marina TaxID=988821 RepID=A0A1I1ADK9_9CELL|nr:5'-nucleotidase C-terminal domain-containing protein [Cellulomonas marina]GIG29709.1 multifunctional 2',3'-cyclic-nucleotide 2'-phosphodiesterase/5'-nucleotidase/3'-nucleotidase [Cellulomonas marina]SFB36064.1 2',3'-cyclic-nucleotide 2'-phosphodiesterase / 3'-nucleotidase [Cellulomonas marina]
MPARPLPGAAAAATAAAALAALALGLAAAAAPAAAAPADEGLELTLLATTDVHGHVRNWDYFADTEYTDDDVLGLTRVGTVVHQVRAERGAESVVVVDNGDAIQGTPLTYWYGYGPGRAGVLAGSTVHPMAQAFNTIGYDAQVVGNHEYNYGLDLLAAYDRDLAAPLLGANVVDVATGQPYHTDPEGRPYTLIEREVDGRTVTIGVLGLVTPGVRVWDEQYVDGVLEFRDMVTTAKEWVPVVDAQADVVVVLAHTGQGTVPDDAYDPAALPEDVANNIAVQVPGIDVLVAGHSHQDVPEEVYTNVAGEKVLLTQPYYWARGVTETTLHLVDDGAGGLEVSWDGDDAPRAVARYGQDVPTESQAVLDAVADEHATTVDYVNTPVATSVTELPAATSRYEDTPIIDFINDVQARTLDAALDGTALADVPVISQASPFSRTAVFPQGEVTIRDIAGLYIYENTLRGVELTGAQVLDYLEYSARYFVQTAPGAAFDPATGTNAAYPDRPQGVPDYNYDVLSGLDYTIDVSQPVGARIGDLTYPDGRPVGDADRFVLAVNNYRQSGGGAFPHVADAPVVYDELLEIRQLLIEEAQRTGTIDPATFADASWTLTTGSVAPDPTPDPTPVPDPTPTVAPDPTASPTPTPTAVPTTGPTAGPTASPTPAVAAARPGRGGLASTGAEAGVLALVAGTGLVSGAVLLLVRRRHRA